MPSKKDPPPRRKIGFITSYDEEQEVEPMKQISTEEEEQEESPALLSDYIPGAVYDGAGNIVTYESFNANVKKTKAETKNLRRISAAKLILYTSLAASILMLSYGAYKKYFSEAGKAKTEMVRQKQR